MHHATPREPADRPLTSRERLTLAAVVTLLVVTAATCASCAATVSQALAPAQRPTGAMFAGTYEVVVSCSAKDGSGIFIHKGTATVVSPTQALTAGHVASCEDGQDMLFMTVDDGTDPAMSAEVDVKIPEHDVARIKLTSGSFGDAYTPVSIGPRPTMGDEACTVSAVPRWLYRCGPVQPFGVGLIGVGMFVEHGMSGSGVFVRGRLVGVMVMTHVCEWGIPCLGLVEPVQDWPWLVPS